MDKLLVAARYKIHNDKIEEFKSLTEQLLSLVKTKDQDTLEYDWFSSQDQTEWILIERYPDSNALLAHIENMGGLFGQIMSMGDFYAEVFGHPSQELINATAGLTVKVYSLNYGISVEA